MMLSKTLILTALSGAVLAASLTTAQARPPAPKPHACQPWVYSLQKSAKKLSKAKQRARGSWESQARKRFGLAWNDWSDAAYRQYGCAKKGKKHYCIAEAYPCKKPHY